MIKNSQWGLLARAVLIVAVGVVGMSRSPSAHADTLLKAATTMVNGSASDTYSLTAPSAGTVTAEVSSVPWPVPLAALSFNVTSATDVLSPEAKPQPQAQAFAASDAMTQSQTETYQVGPGTYFAHVSATAAGVLSLGLYSVMFTFSPSAVPLPAAAGMLLIGLLVFFGLRRTLRETASAIEEATFGATPG